MNKKQNIILMKIKYYCHFIFHLLLYKEKNIIYIFLSLNIIFFIQFNNKKKK